MRTWRSIISCWDDLSSIVSCLGWVGLGQPADGLGWIGSHKMDPWTTRTQRFRPQPPHKDSRGFGASIITSLYSSNKQISLPDQPVLLATFPLGPFLCLHLLLETLYLHTFVLSMPYPLPPKIPPLPVCRLVILCQRLRFVLTIFGAI